MHGLAAVHPYAAQITCVTLHIPVARFHAVAPRVVSQPNDRTAVLSGKGYEVALVVGEGVVERIAASRLNIHAAKPVVTANVVQFHDIAKRIGEFSLFFFPLPKNYEGAHSKIIFFSDCGMPKEPLTLLSEKKRA